MRVPIWICMACISILMLGWGLQIRCWYTHDCPVTVVEVASDTIPPVVRGWMIDGDNIREITFDHYGVVVTYPDTIFFFSQWSDSSSVKSIATTSSVTKWYTPAEVYADRTLAEAELCRRTHAQIEELRKKREQVGCE